MILGTQPGRDELLLGRIGTAFPRAPASISTPGQVGGAQPRRGITMPEPLPVPRAPLYGSLALPADEASEGPADGLTLDQAIELLVKNNYDLRSKFMEIPQARADVLTASLRANPILYADSQLVPYGSFSERRPSGPTQYDLNISHPLDYSHKRRARTDYAVRALKVTEAQYQDAVRAEINNLYIAFVEVLSARQILSYTKASVAGLQVFQEKTQLQYDKDVGTRADLNEVKSQRQIAEVGVVDAEENLRRAKRTLAMLLNLPPDAAESMEVRGSIRDQGPPPPPFEELVQMALSCRPDAQAYGLGVRMAESGLRLARANRYQDAYLLYQPFTYQNNAPFGKGSVPAWALGITFPVPLYNRNQGNIERARENVTQSQIELQGVARRIMTEVRQAEREYYVSRQVVERIRANVLPMSRSAVNDRYTLFQSGEANVLSFLQAQRSYNETVRVYHDTVVRHRRSMLALNTAVGRRILP
jgi:cobalt-zinc-cadmium efflux system outer membrane protein